LAHQLCHLRSLVFLAIDRWCLGHDLKPLATFATLNWPYISHFGSILFVAVGANGVSITRYSLRQVQVNHVRVIVIVRRFVILVFSYARTTASLDALGDLLVAVPQGKIDFQHIHKGDADQAA
jgi:hypothetical protein